MARKPGSNIFTIYHVMDKRGDFDSNPANAQAVNVDGVSIYKGPVEYPKMVFHPKGEREIMSMGTVVVEEGKIVRDPATGQPQRTGDIWGTKNKIAADETQYQEFKALGWHDTEAEALRMNPSSPVKAPPKTLIEQQAEELATLRAKLAHYEANQAAAHTPTKARA